MTPQSRAADTRDRGALATDAARLIELKRAGLSETVISAVVKKCSPAEPLTSGSVIHLVKAVFNEDLIIDLLNWWPWKFRDRCRQNRRAEAGWGKRENPRRDDCAGANRVFPPGTEIPA